MATFNFDSLKQGKFQDKGFLYSDLHLDLMQERISSPGIGGPIVGKDIVLDFDLSAIKNSIYNIFNTLPGQRFLIPEFGLNLLQYVFTPVSDSYGEIIGQDIMSAIAKWEPRVRIQKVLINTIPDANEYDVAIAIYVPALKEYTGLIGKLSQKGFAPINH